MKDNPEKIDKEPNDITNSADYKVLMKIPSRLVIKDIPSTLSDEKIYEIFSKNFDENEIKKDMIVIKLQKKYSLKDRNKICFLTVKNLEIRQKVINFIMLTYSVGYIIAHISLTYTFYFVKACISNVLFILRKCAWHTAY